ncbi:MAG TPA: helix-turn-helix domain-containing protein [Thermomicrobiales bacterium]|nr:helix-turn-helix domain-containing protein [Thermomicrobiales bacterium]
MAVFGDTLRQARSYKGVTIREAEAATRINRHHLAALEEENFDGLPPLIYQRGIVKNYATYLDLDPNKLLQFYEEARGVQPDDPPRVSPLQPLEMPNHFAPNFAIIAFMVFVSAIVFAWLYSAYFAPSDVTSTPAEVIATVTPVDADALVVPSPTVAPPTATPTTPPSPTATNEPEATATEEATIEAASASEAEATIEEDVIDEPTEEPTALPEGAATIKITALADITVDVVADGVSVYSGELAEGESTDWFSGSSFIVFTSSGVNTQFTNDRQEEFLMGYDEGEATYEL